MRVIVQPDGDSIASLVAESIVRLVNDKPNAVLGFATGSSPLGIYRELIKAYQEGKVSFKDAWGFQLDEYVGLPADHPELYRNVIRTVIESHVDFSEGRVHAPNGTADDLQAAGPAYDTMIEDAGGVDFQILGIGTDGHIAFNEPGSSFSQGTHVETLTPQTREDNARFFDGDISRVPTHTLTQGLGTIMKAKKLVLVAEGEGKAEAIAQLIEGPVSAHWPATIMQHHADATVLIDEAAASKLEMKDYYRFAWENRLPWQSV
ncbi:glucosamine-6-phosphate deaminase [Bowdeniella nasicola]|uniref:Glucosamine-6-phosphate deaminase n=1 Tax=Bowdeniella nasicola TaxID=208480 RepID=A0A1H4DQD3_9ACTO|nr:glucosamine-6-phosphate deaminase [Bowdeniella nasicola]SEA74728.1 glucosamine-6-phosphate deaminase [Bowdeniella nasicola]